MAKTNAFRASPADGLTAGGIAGVMAIARSRRAPQTPPCATGRLLSGPALSRIGGRQPSLFKICFWYRELVALAGYPDIESRQQEDT